MAVSSFDGTNIRIELDAQTGAGPAWERQSYAATRHIPGGDNDVTQWMGSGSAAVTYRILVNPSEWTDLEPKLGVEGELIVAGTSQGTCLLEAISGVTREVDGWVTLQAAFRKTT